MSWQAKGGIAVLETSFYLAPAQLSKEMGGIETEKHNASTGYLYAPTFADSCV